MKVICWLYVTCWSPPLPSSWPSSEKALNQLISLPHLLKIYWLCMCYAFHHLFCRCIRKIVKSFFMSVRPHGTTLLLLDRFLWIWYLIIFKKICPADQVSLISDQNTGHFTWKPIYIFDLSHWIHLGIRIVSHKSWREIHNTRFMFHNFFWKSCHSWNNAEKCCRARQVTDDNMEHAHCMLDT